MPSHEEIRSTVERMIQSEAFSRSPQLSAFLRFVVEAVLQGRSNRIKGYTIGVEVLRRDASFDPQADPIVRVEATRLRRAIERYYAGPGVDDPVIVDLPRGSYVPTFRCREANGDAHARPWFGAETLQRWRRPAVAVGLAIVALGLVGGAILLRNVALTPDESVATRALAAANGMPTMLVESLEVTGQPAPAPGALSPSLLVERIRDAFSRFDTINIVVGQNESIRHRIDYRLQGAVDYRDGQPANVRFRLLDADDGNIVWSQAFENIAAKGEQAASDEILVSLSSALLQSYGLIRSRDRARHLVSDEGDPRYRCILQAADALRSQERAQYESARGCLEQHTRLDPSFSVGFTFLALLCTRQHQMGRTAQPDDLPPLDRALRAVRRAIELNPTSSRAYVAMMVVLFARGDVTEAFAAGDKALTLNPYDMLAVAEYGGRLIMSDQVGRGLTMLRRAGEYGSIRPSWQHFYLFMGNYLAGDLHEAAYQASQITAEDYSLGHLAKAFAAAAAGDQARARDAIDRLVTLAPAWREDPRQELQRFIPNPGIVERLTRDLAAAGLRGRS